MSQGQTRRPEAVKYCDLFQVFDELASKPIAPQDASSMQAAENIVLEETKKGGPDPPTCARRGAAGDMTSIVREQGATISEAEVGSGAIRSTYRCENDKPGGALDTFSITVGEALEAAGLSAGGKPIDESDAAAIQAAESRATRLGHVVLGGVAAEAQSVAAYNI
ncbi:unnamed protein product [Fraxinus pennsylvanica]|uniref:SMP domain-containing protein n=1 Tax=Fraxinus pennsylvanica TaxID=56036 RepID=A0AAD2ADK4_9LAMI|nr:unnamed protein product [Fraxinus pennsylvanica]